MRAVRVRTSRDSSCAGRWRWRWRRSSCSRWGSALVPRRESLAALGRPGDRADAAGRPRGGAPGRPSASGRDRAGLSIGLTVLLAVSALVPILIFELVTGSQVTSSADSLLASGTLVRVGNALVFGVALLAAARLGDPSPATGRFGRTPTSPSPSSLSPELAPPDWRPRYVDYFVLGLTTSTAFSRPDRRDAHGGVGCWRWRCSRSSP